MAIILVGYNIKGGDCLNNKTHKIGGVCLGMITSTILSSNDLSFDGLLSSGLIITGSIVGSLAPDIDHPESKVGRKFVLRPISILINKLFGHRTITHSLVTSSIMFLLLFAFANSLNGFLKFICINSVIGFCVGWLSHLLLDIITVKGIPIFYPIVKKKYNLLSFKTTKDEDLVSIITMLLTGVVIVLYFKGK